MANWMYPVVHSMRYGIVLIAAFILLAGCGGAEAPSAPPGPAPEVEIVHSPVVAKATEIVAFQALVRDDGGSPTEVDIVVNGVIVETCPGLTTGGTCIHSGGPYPSYEDDTVSYQAEASNATGTDSKGTYFFAITDSSYNWSHTYMPARKAGDTIDHYDMLFHRADDYASVEEFVDDVEDKIFTIFAGQHLLETPLNFDDFNFFIYSREAKADEGSNRCGTIDVKTQTEVTFRNIDVVLHTSDITDCTRLGLGIFSAEGHETKAFLHESGHGVFGLGDEYDSSACSTLYFNEPEEPNIWDNEDDCRDEQTSKGRDPDMCREFTSCQGGWWGIHADGDQTVMQWGDLGDPWGTEGEERLYWWFGQPMP